MDIDGLEQGCSNSHFQRTGVTAVLHQAIDILNLLQLYASIWHLPIIRIIEPHKSKYVAP